MQDNVILQEFYCNDCEGEGAYFRVRLHASFNRNVVVVCPKCKRQHPRRILGGVISNDRDFNIDKDPYDEIHVPLASWSQEPLTVAMAEARDTLRAMNKEARELKMPQDGANVEEIRAAIEARVEAFHRLRNGAVMTSDRDIIEESWADRHCDSQQEAQ